MQSSLFSNGNRLRTVDKEVEDYGVAMIETADGTVLNLGCCWNMNVGREADIAIAFYGTQGGARLRNVDGSFYDFVAERFDGTKTEMIGNSENDWGGLATVEWINRLASDEGFDPNAERFVSLAQVIDRIYGR